MGRKEYLTDTNVVIYYLGSNLTAESEQFMDSVFEQTPYLTVINRIELLCSKSLNEYETNAMESFIRNCYILDLDEDIVSETIRIRKEFNLKLPDSIIAATCMVNNLQLVTNNDRDFRKVSGLKISTVDCLA